MTEQQIAHSYHIATQFSDLMYKKYQKGQQEHGGNLWDHDVLWYVDQSLDEAIDQVVYLMTLKEKLEDERSAKKEA